MIWMAECGGGKCGNILWVYTKKGGKKGTSARSLGVYFSTPRSSVADPEHFDADPDPTFQADADPHHFTRVKICFLQIINYCFQSLIKLVIVIFSVKMREEG